MKKFLLIAILFLTVSANAFIIRGHILLNEKWENKVFLSKLDNINAFTMISSKMIIAETKIDSVGYFEIEMPNAPSEDRFYRIHFILKDAKPASLIVGGKDENFFTLILNNKSSIYINADADNFVGTYEVQGSKDCDEIRKILTIRKPLYDAADKMEAKMEKAAATELFSTDSLNKIRWKLYGSYCIPVIRSLQPALKKHIRNSSYPLANIYAAVCMGFPDNLKEQEEFYTELDEKLEAKAAASDYVKQFHKAMTDSDSVLMSSDLLITISMIVLIVISLLFIWIMYQRKLLQQRSDQIKKIPVDVNSAGVDKLTKKELEVYMLLQLDKSNKEIAAALYVELSTIKTHINNIYKKLNIQNRKAIKKPMASEPAV